MAEFVCPFQKPGEQEPSEEEEGVKHIDPLHQLIQLFSRTALTEKWWVLTDTVYVRIKGFYQVLQRKLGNILANTCLL